VQLIQGRPEGIVRGRKEFSSKKQNDTVGKRGRKEVRKALKPRILRRKILENSAQGKTKELTSTTVRKSISKHRVYRNRIREPKAER
jgi:hypothetical protein